MYPGTQIVFLILSWVTDGFIAPGVHFGSGRPPLIIWHADGTAVELGNVGSAADDGADVFVAFCHGY